MLSLYLNLKKKIKRNRKYLKSERDSPRTLNGILQHTLVVVIHFLYICNISEVRKRVLQFYPPTFHYPPKTLHDSPNYSQFTKIFLKIITPFSFGRWIYDIIEYLKPRSWRKLSPAWIRWESSREKWGLGVEKQWLLISVNWIWEYSTWCFNDW